MDFWKVGAFLDVFNETWPNYGLYLPEYQAVHTSSYTYILQNLQHTLYVQIFSLFASLVSSL
jgi:hypothetical protein